MPMTLRYEIFPLTPFQASRTISFYTNILRFKVLHSKPDEGYTYIARDSVYIGIVCPACVASPPESYRLAPSSITTEQEQEQEKEIMRSRLPPVGIETVYEVDDLDAEWEVINGARGHEGNGEEKLGWNVVEGVKKREWGLRDFRVVDPAGYYVRITGKSDGKGQGREE